MYFHINSIILSIYISCCYYNKLPQTYVLKQHKFILSFWRLEVQTQSDWAEVKLLAWLAPPGGSEEKMFPCLFQLLDNNLIPWLVVTSSMDKG